MRTVILAACLLLLSVLPETSVAQPPQAPAAAPPPAATAASRFTREPNLDRSGNDLRKDILPPDAGIEVCEQRCLEATGCVAFTYVKRSTTVPQPICWLKATVPVGYSSECCISGVLQK
ncbi:MAG: PAN domain-containing protein [Hyphomicrobiaceae bacterium]